MQINGPTHLHGAHPINPPRSPQLRQPTPQVSASEVCDEVQISEAARAAEQAQSTQEVRADRVASIRAQIAEGTYETADKLDVAVARLLDEIG
jgi:negative regulator of flagellin synthesis FlgM